MVRIPARRFTGASHPTLPRPPGRAVELVKVFLATRPEHRYARRKLLKHADLAGNPEIREYTVDGKKWARERGK